MGGIVAYSGVDGSDPVEGHSGSAGAGTSITAPSAAASSGAMVVGTYGAAGNASIEPPAGMAEQAESKSTRFVAWEASDGLQEPAGQTGDRTATATKGYDNVGQLTVLRPAG
jgi:hypothetical protein